eukprot:7007503-Prymnesium_polylepis.3
MGLPIRADRVDSSAWEYVEQALIRAVGRLKKVRRVGAPYLNGPAGGALEFGVWCSIMMDVAWPTYSEPRFFYPISQPTP